MAQLTCAIRNWLNAHRKRSLGGALSVPNFEAKAPQALHRIHSSTGLARTRFSTKLITPHRRLPSLKRRPIARVMEALVSAFRIG